jgi:hypothetical protein
MSFSDAIKQTSPNVVQEFGDTLAGRNTFWQRTPGLRNITNMSANTGQTIASGAMDIGKSFTDSLGERKLGIGGTPMNLQNTLRATRGVSKIAAASSPFFQSANIISNLPFNIGETDLARRVAKGVTSGMSQTPGLRSTAQNRYTNILGNDIDLAQTAGEMMGYVKNPQNKAILDITGQLFPTLTGQSSSKAIKALNWLGSTFVRGIFEDIALNYPDMPDNLTNEQKAKWMINTGLQGGVMELGGQAIMQGGGELAQRAIKRFIGDEKQLAKAYDLIRARLQGRATSRLIQRSTNKAGEEIIDGPLGLIRKVVGKDGIERYHYRTGPKRGDFAPMSARQVGEIEKLAKDPFVNLAELSPQKRKQVLEYRFINNLDKPIQKARTERVRFKQDPNNPNRYLRVDPENMYGAMAGIEPYQDEEGNWKVGYNPERGVLGMGLMAGRNAINYDDSIKFSSLLDKKPRFEIDDSGAKLKDLTNFERVDSDGGPIFVGKLGDLLDHPKLYQNYPQLKNANVEINPNKKWTQKGEYSTLPNGEPIINITGHDKIQILTDYQKELKDWQRVLSSEDELIKEAQSLNEPVEAVKEAGIARVQDLKQRIKDIKDVPDDAKSTLLHEIQHAIQEIERFARGGSSTDAKMVYSYIANGKELDPVNPGEQMVEKVDQLNHVKRVLEDPNTPTEDKKALIKAFGDLESIKDKIKVGRDFLKQNSSLGLYKRLAGELEARAVQRRMDMPMDARLRTDPYAAEARVTTSSTDPGDFITRFDSSRQSTLDDTAASIKISDDLAARNKAAGVPDSAVKELDDLMNYPKYLAQMGYSPEQIDKIGVNEYKRIIKENIPPFAHETWADITEKIKIKQPDEILDEEVNLAQAIAGVKGEEGGVDKNIFRKAVNRVNQIFSPIKNQTANIQDASRAWDRANKMIRYDKNQINSGYKELANNLGIKPDTEFKLIQYSQINNPTKADLKRLNLDQETVEKAKPLIEKHRQFNDILYEKAQDAGFDLNYLKNHILQQWKQTQEQIDDIIQAKGLGKTPGFTKSRVIENYEKGVKLGLTPNFTTFGQLNAEAYGMLEKAIANREFANILIESKQLLPANKAPASWEMVTARFFPTAKIKVNGKTLDVPYKASPQMAEYLNNMFGGQRMGFASKVLKGLGDFMARVQDIILTGGLGSINGFTVGHVFKDFTGGLGDIVTLHPVRGINTMTSSPRAMLRAFIPDDILGVKLPGSKSFEQAHSKSIREMISQGLEYRGVENYKIDQPNVSEKFIKQLAKKPGEAWYKLLNKPTFAKFMYQRKVTLYEGFKNAFLKKGLDEKEAISKAASMLKNYDGMVEDMGRSEDVKNFLRGFFFAPRYREAVVGAQSNVLKGATLKIADPTYSASRSLGLGMAIMYLIYNQINKKLNNGRNIWENPPGRQFEVMIPVKKIGLEGKEGDYLSIPWMPGFTAVPRRAIEGTSALIQGDYQEAGRQYSGLTSSGLNIVGETLSGKDYFGREIYDESKPILPQAAKYMATSLLPSYGREYIRFKEQEAKGKSPNKVIAIARALELPIKEGNENTQWYFASQNKVLKEMDKQDKEVYEEIYGSAGKNDKEPTNTIEKKQQKMVEAQLLLNNPSVVEARRKVLLEKSKKTGEPVDPFFLLTPEQQRVVLLNDAEPPGSEVADELVKANIDWLKPYWTARSAYYDELEAKGVFDNQEKEELPGPKFVTDPAILKLQDQYFELPYGTGQRTAFIQQHPELAIYWDEKRQYENEMRVAMGLPPIEDSFGYGKWGSYKKKPKKITIKGVDTASYQIKPPKISAPVLKLSENAPDISAPKIDLSKILNQDFESLNKPIKINTGISSQPIKVSF